MTIKGNIFSILLFAVAFSLISFSAGNDVPKQDQYLGEVKALYQHHVSSLIEQVERLENLIDAGDRENFQIQIDHCRIALKRAEPLLLFFDQYNYNLIFGDPIPDLDEETGEVIPPRGLLVLEELLEKEVQDLRALQKEVRLILRGALSAKENAGSIQLSGKWLFHSFRIALLKAYTLNITGTDNIRDDRFREENSAFFHALAGSLSCFDRDLGDKVRECAKVFEDPDVTFNNFDRIRFYRNHLKPLYHNIQLYCQEKNIPFPDDDDYYNVGFNSRSNGFFESDFSKPYFHFPKRGFKTDSLKIKLGEKLFFDPILSGDLTRSCATCHQPSNAFTDGMKTALAYDGINYLERNTPTLVNASYQSAFQLDGNASLPEEQFTQVIFNPHEMGLTQELLIKRLNASKEYDSLFRQAFHWEENYRINDRYVIEVLGHFLRTLNGLNSRFDRYMRGEALQLTDQEIAGANIFLGKGQCATCHFVPYFNGLKPPFLEETENEVIGTPKSNAFVKTGDTWNLDTDQGLHFHTDHEKDIGSFKTPTVRNSALTGPYMHNGVFDSLDHVIEFYDLGGGQGLGIDVPSQTLPSEKLDLTLREKQNLIAFLHTLTDTSSYFIEY